jgi:glutathione S-transferase
VKLHWSPKSPFVRKVMIVAEELGLAPRIEKVRTVVIPSKPNPVLQQDNPLSKTPTLILDDGTSLYDSPVICEYLDSLHDGRKMIPVEVPQRWITLRRQALADGMLDILTLWRDEDMRPEDKRSQPMIAAYRTKLTASLDRLETEIAEVARTPFDVAHAAIGSMLGYIDFRFPHLDFRPGRPALSAWHAQFEQRPSALATRPVEDSATPQRVHFPS